LNGNKRVVVTRLGILHRYILCIWYDSVSVFCGVVDWERELWDFCFVKCKIGDFGGIWRPPKGIISREDLFLVHPVWDSMEERCVASGCNANWTGIRPEKCQLLKVV
jgi:hypothetical protein